MLRQERPDLMKRYWKRALWLPSYFAASCGGAPVSILKEYIDQQKTPRQVAYIPPEGQGFTLHRIRNPPDAPQEVASQGRGIVPFAFILF